MIKITEKTDLIIRKSTCSEIIKNTIQDPKTGCLYWKGSKDKAGHGICHFNMKSKRVHRIVMLLMGNDISGKNVAHCCGRPECCNPDHLVFISRTKSACGENSQKKKPLYSVFRYRVSSDRARSARNEKR